MDNNNGYNDALSQLRTQAEEASMTESVQVKAKQSAEQEISRLVNFLMPQSSIEFKWAF